MILICSALAATPHYSYPKLVTANGYGAAVWNGDRVEDFFPHLYQELSPGVVTPDVLYDTYFGIVDGTGGRWLLDWDAVAYEPGTGVFTATGTAGSYALTLHVLSPMTGSGPGLAQVLTVTNTGTTFADLQVVSLQNWHVGGAEDAWSPASDRLEERGADVEIFLHAPGATDASCNAVYDTVNAGARIGGGCDTSGDDVVPGFGWSVGLDPGEGATVGVYAGTSAEDGWSESPVLEWVPAELGWWEAWHALDAVAAAGDEVDVAAQALAFLAMAQVREDGDPHGQIAASLPLSAAVGDLQHIWNITWVRDGSYAASALASAGHPDEAADLLRFLIQPGKTGAYRAYVGDADYALSVCRVYGDGTEWSDTDANGPNVEFDNFGLYLWAYEEVRAAGVDLDAELGARVLDGVADVLVRLVDPNTGLLLPDSSIWERHWNGHQEQFTYSSVWAATGLEAAARIADRLGDGRGVGYRAAAATLRGAIRALVVDAGGVVGASREQVASGSDYLDLAAIEAFNQGVFGWTEPMYAASVAAWDRELQRGSGGYIRNDDGDTYDGHEWVFIDLRVAEARARAGDAAGAAELADWVTGQAQANHLILPELYHPDTADYAGPAPMLGFGAGAYVWYLNHRDPDPEDACVGCDTADPEPAKTGCGCSTTTPGAGWFPLLPALIHASRRRRPSMSGSCR